MADSCCIRCNTTETLERHHKVYRCNGGGNGDDNIEILCRDCHVRLHQEAGDYTIWGRGGGLAAAELIRLRGEEGRAFLAEIGRRGGLTVRDRYGIDYLQEIGGRGGRTTVARYGRTHMAAIGRRGGQATAARNGRN